MRTIDRDHVEIECDENIEEVNTDDNNDNDGNEEEVRMKRTVPELKLHSIDLHRLVALFDTYATKKTYATSFFNLALIATNFTQLKQLIVKADKNSSFDAITIVLMIFIIISLVLQVIVGVVLVFLAKKTEFIDAKKREELIRSNDIVTLLVIAVSLINVFINVFLNV